MDNNEFQKFVIEQFKSMQDQFGAVQEQFREVNERLDVLDERTKETNDIVHALRENSEYINANLETLQTSTASVDSVKRIDAKLNVLNERLFEQETTLKLVK